MSSLLVGRILDLLEEVGSFGGADVAREEDDEDAVDEEIHVVEPATEAVPLVAKQWRHERMSQKVLLILGHLG